MSIRELLIETVAYIPPASALEQLSTADAETRVPGANHSIAEIVAHATFWMTWLCGRCEGDSTPMVAHAAQGWPAVVPGSWEEVLPAFLAALERAAALGADASRLDRPLTPPIDFPPLAHYTVRDAIVHMANHNSHHLGQVIILRQLLGRWPPPAGSWTW